VTSRKFSVRIAQPWAQRLEERSRASGVSMNRLFNDAVAAHLKELEDAQRPKLGPSGIPSTTAWLEERRRRNRER
jgi:hypothetical protein